MTNGPPPEFPLTETDGARQRRSNVNALPTAIAGVSIPVGKRDTKTGKIAIERIPKSGNFQNYRDQEKF